MSPRVLYIEQDLNFGCRQLKLPPSEVKRVAGALTQMKGVSATALNEGRDLTIKLTASSERALTALNSKVVQLLQHALERHRDKMEPNRAQDKAVLNYLQS